jgi:hypothetical protein
VVKLSERREHVLLKERLNMDLTTVGGLQQAEPCPK